MMLGIWADRFLVFGMVSFGMTCLFDFLKILSCPFEGERKVKKHVVTFARLPF